jgi:glycosyltransferase involved in cell wall biosynthesis
MSRTSIIITSHNRPRLLARAVESARLAGRDLEIVVVDDASTDETAQVCESFGDIHYVRVERNLGVAGARNVGLVVSQGEFVSFLDDDDVRLPGSIDRQVEILKREPQVMFVYGQAISEDENGKQHDPYPSICADGDIFWKLVQRNFIPCGSVVFRRRCLSSIGLLVDQIAGIDDWDLWVRIAEIYPVIAMTAPVLIWRRSTPLSGQGSSRAAVMASRSIRQFRDVWMKLPRARAAANKTRRAAWRGFSRNVAEHLIWQSARSVRRGDLRQPLWNLAQLRRLHPLTLALIVRDRTRQISTSNSSRLQVGARANRPLQKLN